VRSADGPGTTQRSAARRVDPRRILELPGAYRFVAALLRPRQATIFAHEYVRARPGARDRGAHVRTEAAYRLLAARYFASVESHARHDTSVRPTPSST
jgi:hypothetical protein